MTPPYKRVLLKISGEALAGPDKSKDNISQEMLTKVTHSIKAVYEMGVRIAIVVGGGNIYRGISGMISNTIIDRSSSDYMGMLSTVINGIALENAIKAVQMPVRLMSSIPMPTVCEPFSFNRAERHLINNRVVIFTGGTGNPYFTTDTAAALRAAEMKCDLLLKATKVRGVFCSDPQKNSNAEFLPRLSYKEVKDRNLTIMDRTAITFTEENNIPIAVFSIYDDNGFANVISGKGDFTLIS